jgi:bacterioferritin (cytochrome b1)
MSSIITPGNVFGNNPVGVVPPGTAAIGDGGEVVRQLNALLRGEISAAETYRNVLDKAAEGEHAENVGLLREIQAEHGRACQSLRNRIRELNGEPSDSSGAWGVWAAAVQSTLTLFGGDKGGLKALKEGEEHGLKEYEDSIQDLDPTSAQLIENQLVPGQRRHISLLDQLLI